MKRILSIVIVAALLVIVHGKTVIAQDAKTPHKNKTEKHIKMVKVDDNGKKTSIDTVITGDAPFVWEGDTVGGKEFKWVTKNDFALDSVHEFEYKIHDDGKGMIFIHKGGNDCEDFMVPPVPHAPKVMMFDHGRNKNVIDLSDPGIISYDKKLRKDGTEKITIVRKQIPEGEEMEEDVFIHAPVPPEPLMHPGHSKKVRVIKSDDGTVQVFEDDEVIDIKSHNGEAKFITDDGKVIHMKEKKSGDGKETEVEVEVKEEKENK
jgi:hypothetical protein